jgi:hypothetical protein
MTLNMTTLVTAFFSIPSKRSEETYLAWATHFLTLDAPIVLFTEERFVNTFRSMRDPQKPLHILTKSFEELDTWVLYEEEWKAHKNMDHEAYHTPELYALWAQKPFFVEEAINTNPFQTEFFYWCDMGAFRSPLPPPIRTSFPTNKHLSKDSILLSAINPITPQECEQQSDGCYGNFKEVNRIVGGLWGGGAQACLRWRTAFESMLCRHFATGRFAGKDQSVMLATFLEWPSLARIVKSNIPNIDIWFYATYLLSELAPPLEYEPSYETIRSKQETKIVSVSIKGGLGNQLFQMASGFAHARRHKAAFQVLRHKREPDRRPLYWNSVLGRWEHTLVDSLPSLPNWCEPSSTEYVSLPSPNVFLDAYLQTSKYFQPYEAELRYLMRASKEALLFVRNKYADLLKNRDRIVVVHARRTDYCTPEWNRLFHGPLTTGYYKRALEHMSTLVKNPIFLLCSDDNMYWIEQLSQLPQLQTNPFVLLDETDVNTLALFQQFQHFVLANSTFSWWGAWLANAKHVCAPNKWVGPACKQRYDDIYEPHWIRIEV